MSNALSPPAPGTPQRDSEARNKRQDRRRPELVAYAATLILAAAGVPDPAAHAHHVDEHLVRLGYLLTDPERHDAEAAAVNAHDRQHWQAMAIDLVALMWQLRPGSSVNDPGERKPDDA